MTIRLLSAALLGAIIACPLLAANAPSADDFLPIANGGSEKVEHPADVKKDNGVVNAATAQDAVNAAIEDLGAAPGSRMVKFGSGVGFVASGVSTYLEMDNPTATRISKRNAYVAAFSKAKKELAAVLGGLTNESKETVRESLVTADLPKETLANLKNQTEESIKQSVDMLLRRFVVYEVKDDTASRTVKVVIAVSPKTLSSSERLSANAVSASSIKTGLEQVMQEVRSGVAPPVGGRIVTVPSTGETAFVGFGSAVVRSNANGTVQAKLNLAALQQSQMRASASLCGLLKGDKTSWEGGLTEGTKEETKQFEEAESGVSDSLKKAIQPLADVGADPLKNTETATKLDKERQSFVARMEQTDTYRSASRGVLPPGVTSKTWFSDDKGWACAVSVYMPSMTAEAQKVADGVKDGGHTPAAGSPMVKPVEAEGNGIHDNAGVQRPSNEVGKGADGKVSGDGL